MQNKIFMVFNCLGELFSFNCQRRKRRSKEAKIDKSDSDSDGISTLNQVVNSEAENEDIIHSYSKSESNSKVKIKKSIVLDNKDTKNKQKSKANTSFRHHSTSSSETEEHKSAVDEKSSDRPANIRSVPKTTSNRTKVKITKEGNLENNSSVVDNLNESLKSLDLKKKYHKLDRVVSPEEKITKTKKSESKPFHQNIDVESSAEYINDSKIENISTTTCSISNTGDRRNILTREDLTKINDKDRLALDSDSEIWFLKNKSENTKFNYSLKKTMVEYLSKKKRRHI